MKCNINKEGHAAVVESSVALLCLLGHVLLLLFLPGNVLYTIGRIRYRTPEPIFTSAFQIICMSPIRLFRLFLVQ